MKRGTSSILGTLIFIGILFSAVLPLFHTMNQADIVYEQKKLDVERLDEEKELEDIEIYLMPDAGNIDVIIVNNCEVPITVYHLWINDELFDIPETTVDAQEEQTIEDLDISPEVDEEYEFIITTERGNTFVPANGKLLYTSEGWTMETFLIKIYAAELFIRVIVTQDETVFYDDWSIFEVGYAIPVPSPGTYHVYIEKSFFWSTTVLFDDDVEITWPTGPSYVEVFI